jgi:hypothetical protein
MIAMTFELSARTDAGRDLVALAERLSADSRPGPATTTARRPTRSRTSRRSGRPAPGTGS